MMNLIRTQSRRGLVSGSLMLFVILIGLTTTVSNLLGDFLDLDSATRVGNTGGLMIFFGLLGLWVGYRAACDYAGSTVKSISAGFMISLVMGLVVSLFIYLIGTLDAADVEMRKYFVQLSRTSVQLLIYGREPLPGSLLTLLITVVSGGLGGVILYFLEKMRNDQKGAVGLASFQQILADSKIRNKIEQTPHIRWIGYGLLLMVVFLAPLMLSRYWNYALGTVGIYVLMGLGLNIEVGLAGLLDLGYVAFFAIGAYTAGLLTTPAPISLQMGFWSALFFSVVMTATAGILLGLPVLRMRGDYLAIVTLGFGEIIRVLIRSDMMAPYLGGPQGIRNIAGPTIFGFSFKSEKAYLYLIVLGIFLTIYLTRHLQNSRVGRAWMAMREDETVAQAMGINTLYYKLMAFATGAAFAGMGGALFAARNQYTGPADHSLMVSINVLCLLIVGGMGSIPGVIVGAFVLKGFPEVLRELDLYRLLVFGGLLVVMMIWRPEGIWPAPRRKLELHDDEPSLPSREEALTAAGKEG